MPRPSQVDIDAPTPEARWWTAERGWLGVAASALSSSSNRRPPPPPLIATAEEEPSLYPTAEEVIGTLFVEVLEASALPSDWLSKADAYALLVVEASAATTNIVFNASSPAWGASEGYRAFRFPIVEPHATLAVALMESDTHAGAVVSRHLETDDVLGRVTVRLGTLHARTTYDCWFPLGARHDDHRAYLPGRPYDAASTTSLSAPAAATAAAGGSSVKGGGGGASPSAPALRLRYRVTFTSERDRVLRYVRPLLVPGASPPPSHELAFVSRTSGRSHRLGAK